MKKISIWDDIDKKEYLLKEIDWKYHFYGIFLPENDPFNIYMLDKI